MCTHTHRGHSQARGACLPWQRGAEAVEGGTRRSNQKELLWIRHWPVCISSSRARVSASRITVSGSGDLPFGRRYGCDGRRSSGTPRAREPDADARWGLLSLLGRRSIYVSYMKAYFAHWRTWGIWGREREGVLVMGRRLCGPSLAREPTACLERLLSRHVAWEHASRRASLGRSHASCC